IFTLLHQVFTIGSPFGFLPVGAQSIVATVTSVSAFVTAPIFASILIQRLIAGFEEVNDRAVDPFYSHEPKGRKLWVELPASQRETFSLVPVSSSTSAFNLSHENSKYDAKEKPDTLGPVYN